MCNKKRGQKTQRGVSLIIVLFLLVVVSLLAVSLAQLNRGGSIAVAQEIQSTRALYAAESGAQIAAMRIFPINSTPTLCPGFTQAFTASGLNGCSATITCFSVNTAGKTIYTVTSDGICVTGNDRGRRKITVGLRIPQ
jgi:MSHA biogenesis protein MshP